MKNLGLSKKVMICFSIMIIQGLLIATIGLFGLYSMKSEIDHLYEQDLTAIAAMSVMQEAFQQERVYFRDMLIYIDDPAKVNASIEAVNASHVKGDAAVQVYIGTIADPALETAFMEAGGLLEPPTGSYYIAKDKIMEAAKKGDAAGVKAGIDAAAAYVDTIERNFSIASENRMIAAEEKKAISDALFFALLKWIIAVSVIGIGLVIALGVYLSGRINTPLIALTKFMKKASATGDLTLEQEDINIISKFIDIKDEMGQCVKATNAFIERVKDVSGLLEKVADGDLRIETPMLSDKDTIGSSLRKMTNSLNEMFTEINCTSSQVNYGANQIAGGAQDLAQNASDQAAYIEELSVTISEIAEKTKENAKMADEAAALSMEIKSNAEKGNEQMDRLMEAVTDINHASQSISKVMKIIDEIAFQTNILALNASVEAARAGEHGKGFAVVADEVRNLAAKSAESAKDTGAMIENSIAKANLGLNITTETLASLAEIVEGINHNTEIIAHIAQSSDVQAAAISQVDDQIEHVAQVIHQVSATAEESAAASEEMNNQTTLLIEHVSIFKLRGECAERSISMPTNHTIMRPYENAKYTPDRNGYEPEDYEYAS